MQKNFLPFLRAAGITFTFIVMLVSGVNFYFDPANLFGDRTYEAGVAGLMVEGRNVANVTDFDERLLQKFFADRLKTSREVLILGSSRVMNIGPELFSGRTFFNASVSGASLEDIYAILQLYRERKLMPKLLVLGIDPWMFNRNGGHNQWRSLAAEYSRSLPGAFIDGNENGRQNRWQQLVNADYFFAALQSARRNEREYFATEQLVLDVNIKMADGTINYRREYAQRPSQAVLEKVREETTREPVYAALSAFHRLDSEYEQQLEALIDRLRSEGIEVLLFLSPYHPEMYSALSKPGSAYAMVVSAESYVRSLALHKQVRLVGAFDPAMIPCTAGEFFDGMHAKPSCLRKIFAGNPGTELVANYQHR